MEVSDEAVRTTVETSHHLVFRACFLQIDATCFSGFVKLEVIGSEFIVPYVLASTRHGIESLEYLVCCLI